LREADVERLLTMDEALAAVEEAFRWQGLGQVSNRPRQRVQVSGRGLHVMPAGIPALDMMGLKAYTTTPQGTRFLFLLYRIESGELLSIIEADRLGQLRTGAASGVATRHMAGREARTVGLFGSGWQAQSQLEAVCAVRAIRQVKVYSRQAMRRELFAEQMSKALEVQVVPVDDPQQVVADAEIVVTATSAKEPVLRGEWLEPGTHLNAIGANWANRREIDEAAVTRSAVIAVDSLEQAKIESGDLLVPIEKGLLQWEQVHELGEIVAGKMPGRPSASAITLFKSHGVAMEDVAVAARVYEKAKRDKIGEEIPV